MSDHYKRMYVLSEDEYNRLKLVQHDRREQPKVSNANEELAATAAQAPPPPLETKPDHTDVNQPSSPPLPPFQQKHYYSCSICGRTYKQKRDLRRHFKLVHDIEPPLKASIPTVKDEEAKVAAQTPVTTTTTIFKKNKDKGNQLNKRKRINKIASKRRRLDIFDKVKKWMTMPG